MFSPELWRGLKARLYRWRHGRRERPLIVFDLDETLIHARASCLPRPPDLRVGVYDVYLRPGLQDCLETLAETYDLALWSTGGFHYVQLMRAHAMPASVRFQFAWARPMCEAVGETEQGWPILVKDLSKLVDYGFSLERMVLVDDTPHKAQRNRSQYIPIKAYRGEADDRELWALTKFLVGLSGARDFRREQGYRSWRRGVELEKPGNS